MLNSPYWLRPFLIAIFGVLFLSSPATATRDGSTDRPGLDYETIELSVPNPDLCENACKKDGKCRAWTYSWPGAKGPKAMCALKTGVPPKRSDTCCISGIISTSSPVTRTDDQAPAPRKPPTAAKHAPAKQEAKPEETTKQENKPEETDKQAQPSTPQEPSTATTESATTESATSEPTVKPEAVEQDSQPSVTKKQDLPTPGKPAVVEDLPRETPSTQTTVAPLPSPPAVQDEQRSDSLALPPKPMQKPEQQDPDNQQLDATQPNPTKVAACNNYANRAVSQNEENTRLNCRLSGSLWGYSRTAYYNFCIRNPSSEYNGSRAARDRELDNCKRQAASRPERDDDSFLPNIFGDDADDVVTDNSRTGRFCRNFAGQSVRQVRQARRSKCGFGGERWSTSRVRQARLCARIGPRAATQLLNTRNRQIRDCRLAASRRERPVRSHCREYAQTAVRQARQARSLDCGFRGGRWSLSFERHFKWCNKVSRREARREYRKRDQRLEWCE